jgi:hypothetical protein
LQFANGSFLFSIFFLNGEDAIWLAFKYDLKVIISFVITYLKTLNPIIEAFTLVGHGDELESEGNMFGVEISFTIQPLKIL